MLIITSANLLSRDTEQPKAIRIKTTLSQCRTIMEILNKKLLKRKERKRLQNMKDGYLSYLSAPINKSFKMTLPLFEDTQYKPVDGLSVIPTRKSTKSTNPYQIGNNK